ncbi:NAD(P)/FAD-dependent oxidoreductase [Thioclava sp. GXIMD2076]|uniref:flavin-containing monooxygenase n=1 Tax=unclassified Thioclava TaxID=2621713 RepID=UPI0030D2D37B
MAVEKKGVAEVIDTLVVGAGQAGIAMSEHLSRVGISHLVLEKDRIAESWRTRRWDSLVANGPAWHDRFPNRDFDGDGDAFVPKDGVAKYFEDYTRQIEAPIRCGVSVTGLTRLEGRPGFRVETSQGAIEARNVVAATGPFQVPVIPEIVPETAGLTQIHSSAYRNPAQLAQGAVLVVGAGSSGVQIADELNRAGRKTYLSVGPHDRPPRSYRGRDFVWWLGVLGKWDAPAPAPGAGHVTIAVSGAHGGRTIDFRELGAQGITLLGRTEGYADGAVTLADDLRRNLDRGDANHHGLLDEADAYIARMGLDLPEEPQARRILPDPDCVTNPLRKLDLAEAGITTIIWATGFRTDYSWMEVDCFDASGRPVHKQGVAPERGIYFLGLPWLSGRGSSFIWGVWHDAAHIADHMMIQRQYDAYEGSEMQHQQSLSA